jgi:hypothetical protein
MSDDFRRNLPCQHGCAGFEAELATTAPVNLALWLNGVATGILTPSEKAPKVASCMYWCTCRAFLYGCVGF